MSAPTPAGGDDSPQPGYYPDPSIPGYVRYWNGAAWVPGTSRPAPKTGEVMPPAPGRAARPEATRAESAAAERLEETGPVFLDEDPSDEPGLPEPATAWQADTSRQTGFGGERDHRVSWGGGQDPRAQGPSGPVRAPDAAAAHVPAPQGPVSAPGAADVRGQVPESRAPGRAADPRLPAQGGDPTGGPPADRTVTIRPVRSRPEPDPRPEPRPEPHPGEQRPPAEGTMTIRPRTASPAPAPAPAPAAPPVRPQPPVQQQQYAQPQPQPQPQQPQPPAAVAEGPGGGGADSWAQQVHRLARADEGERQQPVVPWKPPVADPFLQLAQAQAAARPAALGRRFAARLIDTVVLGALTAAVAVPVALKSLDHVDGKIEAARQSGRTVTVWLLDGTTAVHLGIVLGALLILGALCEALPVARWGRTLGKRLCGLKVVDIESHEPPSFGAALRRWLVYGVLGLAVVGVLNVLWGLFDRPWRQCWHDKAAHTFVTDG
ncbi:RDD family protein [Streptomyces amakusaensis]|uniref:RDD family protein n=1 Tax=Streptomyces amakusaensis TaxID=67271 RepID=A0ABW0AEZ4_9ACTN